MTVKRHDIHSDTEINHFLREEMKSVNSNGEEVKCKSGPGTFFKQKLSEGNIIKAKHLMPEGR